MKKNNAHQIFNLIFLPAILLTVLFAGSSILINLAQKNIAKQTLETSTMPVIDVWSLLPPIILVITLLIVSGSKPFEKVFRGTLVTFIAITALLTGLISFQEPAVEHWSNPLFHGILDLFRFNFFAILICGFINRFITVSEGIKYYIPFAFVLVLATVIVTNAGLVLATFSLPFIYAMISAIALMIIALLVFNWACKRLPNDVVHPEKSEETKNWFPFVTGAYLLAGSIIVQHLVKLVLKDQSKIQLDTMHYLKTFGFYLVTTAGATVVVALLWTIFGTSLLSKKGWKTTAFYGAMATLIGGLIFVGISAFDRTMSSLPWLSYGVFSGLLKGTSSNLFFPLIQIAYLLIPFQTRFQTKVITEMIAFPLMKSIPLLIVQGVILTFGSVNEILIYLYIFILLLLALLVFASKRIDVKI